MRILIREGKIPYAKMYIKSVLSGRKKKLPFAVNYIGAEAVVWALQDSMERRMTADLVCGVEEEDISQKALLEYQLRIDAINDRFGLGE